MNRLLGLLLILRGLAPVLIVVIIAAVGSVLLNDVRAVLAEPIQSISSQMDTLKTTVETAQTDLDAAKANLDSLIEALDNLSLPASLPNIPAEVPVGPIEIPDGGGTFPSIELHWTNSPSITYITGVEIDFLARRVNAPTGSFSIHYPDSFTPSTTTVTVTTPDIPRFNLPIPGITQIRSGVNKTLVGLNEVFDFFDPAFASFRKLIGTVEAVPDSLHSMTGEVNQAITALRDTAARWSSVLLAATAAILVLVVLYCLTEMLDDLRRGWHLLLGHPAQP